MKTDRLIVVAASVVALLVLVLITSGPAHPAVQPITPAGLAETDGFWSLEFNDERSYRWTNGKALFSFPGLETASWLSVTLTLTAPQYPGARPVAARLHVDDAAPFHFTIVPEWRRYHILAAVSEPRWRTPSMQLITDTWTPGVHDRRQLGIAVSEGVVQPLGHPRLLAVVERASFLAALVMLFSVIVRRPQPYGGMLAAIAVVALGMLGAWTPARLVQMLPTNWSLAGEMLAAAAAVEAVRLRRRMPPYLLPVVAVTVAGTGTLLVAAPGWVIAGAVFLICGAWLSTLAPGHSSGVRPAAPSSIPSLNLWQHVALGGIITIALVSILVPGIADTESPYFYDESYWVPVSVQAFRTAFVERDLDHPFWFDSSWLSIFVSRHPQISKYIIGAGTYLAGYHDVPVLWYDYRQDLAWNKAHGRVLPPEIIGAARLSVALTGALCGAFLYWLGVQVAGPVTGILAVVLFIATPVVWYHARTAMLDIPALMFGLLALNLGIRAVTALRKGTADASVWIAACGAACGAAVGAKLNALLIPIICILAICLTGIAHSNQSDRYTLISGVVSLLLWAWVVFFLSNPMLYPHPIAGIQHMLEMSKIVASGNLAPLPTLASRISAVWVGLGEDGILDSSGLPGGYGWLWLIIGAISLARALLQRQPGAHLSALSVIALWGGVSFVGITLWIPENIDRYYLPLAPIVALLQAYGIIEIIKIYRSTYSKIGLSIGLVLIFVVAYYYETTHHFYPAAKLPSQLGRVIGNSREIADDMKASGFLSFGPYVTLPPGGYVAIFEYKSDTRSETSIGFVDVTADKGRTVITQQEVYGTNGSPSYIEISFSLQERQEIEVRFWYNGNGTGSTSLRSLTIRPR